MEIKVGDRDICSVNTPYKDAEGHEYSAYRFGDAGCWMTQNLRSTYTMQNGIKRSLIKDINQYGSNTEPYYYYPSKSEDTLAAHPRYGLLYSWPAANGGTAPAEGSDAYKQGATGLPSDRPGLCPAGWVVPSDWDWAQLEKEIASHPEKYSSHTTAYPDATTFEYYTTTEWRPSTGNANQSYWGRQMKSPTKVVAAAATNGTSATTTDGTGFNALLVGYMGSGEPYYSGTYAYYWSSSSSSSTAAWRRTLNSSYSGVYRYTSNKYYLFGVRCKKKDN
jgi:uncharacterized protein (TIGR02145 family)